ncbi:uncharacterized protein LOC109825918 isoform X2 [Asparagus officinalis]|uniref:uncharacterized protein LOC109825918 isoform X2 n=1 Tax=Asparagus officinalis TaxID=4686 RepID=UPI00098E13B8|nr:uncharacterized protein LOC109825918 isoform X2 [Asparagus officinalis]
MDNSVQSNETAKSLLGIEQSNVPSSTFMIFNSPGSQNQLQETTESKDSADIEDVKVCDICGDPGLEELLAICSRCSDGAEHIYCMHKKLKGLPEGDWLCEECKFKEETANQNVDTVNDTLSEALEVHHSTKTSQNIKNDFDPNCLPELDAKALNLEEKVAHERPQSPQISAKREESNLKVDLKNSERVPQSCGISSLRTVDAKNKLCLSHESSLHILGADKSNQIKPLASYGGQSVNNSLFSRSQTFSGYNSSKISDMLPSSWGPLSKTVSFKNSNMKPKVQFIESMPSHKQIMSKESNDSRKGQIKKLSKPPSFKSITPSCSHAESITKTQPVHPSVPSQAEDLRGRREKSVVEKKSAILEPLPVNPTSVASVGNLHVKDAPVEIISESKILDIHRCSHDKNNVGCNDGKWSYILKSFGRSSSNLTSQKPCQPALKQDIHEILGAADKSCSIPNATSQRTVPQVVEILHGNDKVKDTTFSGILQQAAPVVSGLLRCRKCNETGHPTQFCSIYKLPVSSLKPSVGQNTRDLHNKSNDLRDAAEAPILKSTIQKDIRLPDHPDKLSMPSARLGYKVPSNDTPLGSSSFLHNSAHQERIQGQDVIRNRMGDPSKIEASDQLNTKFSPHVVPTTASVPADVLRSSAIPQLESIWQGGFEVLRSGRVFKSYEGVQAHLSTYASPKVLEKAIKFPGKVHLEEITYLSSWLCQYQGHSLGEHNIALFFFAKDMESYENSYSKLLEDMIRNDLALKGNISGAELLVLPSNKLPQNFQRWNRLYFLWGVFKGRRPNCSKTMLQLQDKPLEASFNLETSVQDLPLPVPEASQSQKLNCNVIPYGEMPTCYKVNEVKEVGSVICEKFPSSSPPGSRMNAILSCSGAENKKNFDLENAEIKPLLSKENMEEKRSLLDSDNFCVNDHHEERPNRKRSLPTSGDAFQMPSEIMHFKEKIPFIDDTREHKRMRPESMGHVSYNSHQEDLSKSLSPKGPPGSLNADEICLLPIEPDPRRDIMHNVVTDGECSADIPNLELALGAKKKLPEEEILPLLSSNTGDDVEGLLFLSLALHSPEKGPKSFTSI